MNEHEQKVLDDLGVTITCTRIATRPDHLMDDRGHMTRHFRCELTRNGEEMTVYFSQGSGHSAPPTAFDVLLCLADDWIGAEVDYYDWCEELGFTPSRQVQRMYDAVQAQAVDLSRLFVGISVGDLYDELRAAEEAGV